MPFKSLGAASYSPSTVTIVVSVAVCEIFGVKEWCDLENRVRVRSRSHHSLTLNISQMATDTATVTIEDE